MTVNLLPYKRRKQHTGPGSLKDEDDGSPTTGKDQEHEHHMPSHRDIGIRCILTTLRSETDDTSIDLASASSKVCSLRTESAIPANGEVEGMRRTLPKRNGPP